jgi:hypothetical protein
MRVDRRPRTAHEPPYSIFWNQAAPEHVTRILECAANQEHLHAYMGLSPGVVPTELGGGRRLPDACASPEVDSVSTNVLEDLEQIDKSPSKCRQPRDPQARAPKRGARSRSAAHEAGLPSTRGGGGDRHRRARCRLSVGVSLLVLLVPLLWKYSQ